MQEYTTPMRRLTNDMSFRGAPQPRGYISILAKQPRDCLAAATNRFFEDFRMEGMSSEQNEIYLELDSEAFGRAVRSANNAKYLRMKLTKKNVPYLALEMKFVNWNGENFMFGNNFELSPDEGLRKMAYSSQFFEPSNPSTTSRVVTHDVPVRVVAPRLWKEYAEPDVPKFHSSLYLPPVKMIHKVATSMKNMIVKHMVISANNDGEMNFKIESDVATLTTHFGDLVRPDWKDEEHNRLVASQLEPEDENFDRSKFYSVRIEVKTLLQFLNNQQIVFCRLMANIVHMKYLHLYVSNDDFRLQYFIPAVLY
uniref:Checkpoint protein n=1 Tax=Romanomermis culicivorax TaxID=13658 RepID=A0A915IST2_ROMCU